MANRIHMLAQGTRYHGVPPGVTWTACGMVGSPAHDATLDLSRVTCERCKRTRLYRYSFNLRPGGDHA